MTRRRTHGDSDVVSTAIALSLVVAVGISLLILLNSRAMISRQEAVEDLNRDQLLLRSLLAADYALFPDPRYGEGSGIGVIKLRNVGDVPITIFRFIVYRNGSVSYDSGINPSMFITLGVRSEGERTEETRFTCRGCRAGDPILVTIHYVPTALINPADPTTIDPLYRTMLYKVAEFKPIVPQALASPICPIPNNWIFIEFVDPVEEMIRTQGGPIQAVITNRLRFRVTMASNPNLDATINIVVTDGTNQMTGSVQISPPYPRQYEVELRGPVLRYPVSIRFTSDTVDIRPELWRFNTDSEVLMPDYMRLSVDNLNNLVVGLLASAYATEDTSATVRVDAYCGTETMHHVARGETVLDFEVRGTNYVATQSMGYLNPTVQMALIRVVEMTFSDVTVIVWTTATRYVTTTTTQTLTSFRTTTVPRTTVTTTSTSVVTASTTRVVSTTTTTTSTTSTSTSWATSWTTTTIILTSTTSIPTATTTITLATTVTSYTTTSTRTSTSTRFTTTTVFSPTVRSTETRYTTVYTTTTTIRTTITSFTTTTTSTTTTTTTTVRMSVDPIIAAPDEALPDTRLIAFLLSGFGLAGAVSGILFRLSWRRYGVMLR